jgi:ADP-ribosylglycohydrolase
MGIYGRISIMSVNMTPTNSIGSIERARLSFEGLSVGDAFGDTYFINPDVVDRLIELRALAPAPWRWTDDTLMGVSLLHSLEKFGNINQDWIAADFAARYVPNRGYGPNMHAQLRELKAGGDWREVASTQFSGMGSYGNGSAMRVSMVGAYFADDLPLAIAEAERSALITHTNIEAVVGAVAVTVATALACQPDCPAGRDFLDAILPHLAPSETATRVRWARDLHPDCTVFHAAEMLGRGWLVACQDTVPLCLWCASRNITNTNYEAALWETVSALGDRDTTCAIVGGIIACRVGYEGIPATWRKNREPLPQ